MPTEFRFPSSLLGRRLRVASLLALLPLLASCATVLEEKEWHPPVGPGTAYDAVYPYYVELCALSQIRAKFTDHGGSGGHAVMYLKGACRDEDVSYPQLKVCGDDADLTQRSTGTGVSVNKVLKNVSWLAVPGSELFYYGNLQPDQRLDADHAIATIHDADRSGVFAGIEVHEQYLPPDDKEETAVFLAAAQTLGTDFALNFGRTSYCARIPMGRPQLEAVIDYANEINRGYASGEVEYNWSGYSDNCSHLVHNSLAAAGVWKEKGVRLTKFRQMFNLSVPANEFINLALMFDEFPVDDFEAIYDDPVSRRSLVEDGWLPVRHGAMLETIPVHPNNDLYETEVRIFVIQKPFYRFRSKNVGPLFEEPRYTDTVANLRHYREVYAGILARRPADWADGPGQDERGRAKFAYYEYVEEQLADVDAKLRQLGVE